MAPNRLLPLRRQQWLQASLGLRALAPPGRVAWTRRWESPALSELGRAREGCAPSGVQNPGETWGLMMVNYGQ